MKSKINLKTYTGINRCLWRFCGLLPSFLWLCVGSSKFFARLLKRIALLSISKKFPYVLISKKKSPCQRKEILSLSAPSPLKNPLYAWILSFIYKAAHSLWNILFPFGRCAWIWESACMWFTLETSLRMQPHLVW